MGSKIGAVIDPRTDKLNQMMDKILKERVNPMDINLEMLKSSSEIQNRRKSIEIAPLLKEFEQPYISPGDEGEPGSGDATPTEDEPVNGFQQTESNGILVREIPILQPKAPYKNGDMTPERDHRDHRKRPREDYNGHYERGNRTPEYKADYRNNGRFDGRHQVRIGNKTACLKPPN